MSSPFPAPDQPETAPQDAAATAAEVVKTVTVTHVYTPAAAAEPPDFAAWIALAAVLALVGGLVVGYLLARFLTLSRMDQVARAFLEGREVALAIGRDLRLRAYPLRRLNPHFAVSPATNAYMVIPDDSRPLVTEGGRQVWIALDLGRVIAPASFKYDPYTELCMVSVVPRDCEALETPECWEKLAKAAAELGGWQTFVGPLRVMVSMPTEKVLYLLGAKAMQLMASIGHRLEAFSLSLTKADVMKWFTSTLQMTIQRYWVYILLIVIIAIIGMAVVSAVG
jgi:membrane protein YqaA with SNARE-associated domain